MSLLERAKRDIERITSNTDEWARLATFTAPTGETATVALLHTKHHLGVDPELRTWSNVKNAHLSVSEKALTDAGYPVRKAGEVFMLHHKVVIKDSTGNDYTYNVDSWFPDESVGLITCILGTREN